MSLFNRKGIKFWGGRKSNNLPFNSFIKPRLPPRGRASAIPGAADCFSTFNISYQPHLASKPRTLGWTDWGTNTSSDLDQIQVGKEPWRNLVTDQLETSLPSQESHPSCSALLNNFNNNRKTLFPCSERQQEWGLVLFLKAGWVWAAILFPPLYKQGLGILLASSRGSNICTGIHTLSVLHSTRAGLVSLNLTAHPWASPSHMDPTPSMGSSPSLAPPQQNSGKFSFPPLKWRKGHQVSPEVPSRQENSLSMDFWESRAQPCWDWGSSRTPERGEESMKIH